jgi:acyl carrier protein
MSTPENWTPLTHEQIEKRFIEMINKELKLDLIYPLDPNMSIKDLRLVGDQKVVEEFKDLDQATVDILKKDYEIDSIDVLELVIQIEEEFGCVIDDKEIATLLRWEDLIGYIKDSQDPTKIKKK